MKTAMAPGGGESLALLNNTRGGDEHQRLGEQTEAERCWSAGDLRRTREEGPRLVKAPAVRYRFLISTINKWRATLLHYAGVFQNDVCK